MYVIVIDNAAMGLGIGAKVQTTRWVARDGIDCLGGYMTHHFHQARTWKTRRGVELWLAARPGIKGVVVDTNSNVHNADTVRDTVVAALAAMVKARDELDAWISQMQQERQQLMAQEGFNSNKLSHQIELAQYRREQVAKAWCELAGAM